MGYDDLDTLWYGRRDSYHAGYSPDDGHYVKLESYTYRHRVYPQVEFRVYRHKGRPNRWDLNYFGWHASGKCRSLRHAEECVNKAIVGSKEAHMALWGTRNPVFQWSTKDRVWVHVADTPTALCWYDTILATDPHRYHMFGPYASVLSDDTGSPRFVRYFNEWGYGSGPPNGDKELDIPAAMALVSDPNPVTLTGDW